MINHFISSVRNKREYNDLDQAPEISVSASQEERAGIRELNVVYQRLPKEQKEALHLIGLQEQSYEEAAEATGCAVGTLKSRVHRARTLLRAQMYGEIRDAA
jgi:RNA polymerase sigma-70 factor (ECF subfamily)